jgi:hypothetical protein
MVLPRSHTGNIFPSWTVVVRRHHVYVREFHLPSCNSVTTFPIPLLFSLCWPFFFPVAEFLVILVLNLRSRDLRLILGRAPLYNFILICVSHRLNMGQISKSIFGLLCAALLIG